MVKRALLIAYHYPPVQISSGVQRTLAFSRDLPDQGWEPLVLSAHPRAYEKISEGQLKDIPENTVVQRAWAWDTARHLSLKGRYLDAMALPDRWVSWCPSAVVAGLNMIRKYKPQVIFSTYPIATAHLIALALHKLTGIPWVADFRDSMTEDSYPREARRRKVFLWLERQVVNNCCKAIFTTPGAVKMYRERYPELPEDRWALIPNGYNEAIFTEVEASLQSDDSVDDLIAAGTKPLTLVHSGVLYPSERDPRAFFAAVASLKEQGKLSAESVQIVLRATGHDSLYAPMLKEHKIDDIIRLEAGVEYRQALQEMLDADGLLIFQATNCNHQIPAKLYEYFRAQKPIFALTDRQGDTGQTLLSAGIESLAPLDDKDELEKQLLIFIEQLQQGVAAIASPEAVRKSSRQYGSEILATIFQEGTGLSDNTVTVQPTSQD
ncbi:glycosyltransferase [Pseudomaricurvus sp.]|uniref:glycosyltransferase n=1 Tax=Pseudomaricurvus sp. TaxID=2004510 RepID=UPI003F6CB267